MAEKFRVRVQFEMVDIRQVDVELRADEFNQLYAKAREQARDEFGDYDEMRVETYDIETVEA